MEVGEAVEVPDVNMAGKIRDICGHGRPFCHDFHFCNVMIVC